MNNGKIKQILKSILYMYTRTKEGKEKHEQLLRLLQDDAIHEELTQLLLSKMGSE